MFTLDYKSRLPIYEQLYQSVLRMAALGALDPGEAIPSVRSVAQELGVNPNTVQKAYRMLEKDGVICTMPGKGSFLSGDFSAVSRRREIAMEKLDRAVRTAADCGITKAEVVRRIDSIFSERGARQ